MITRFAPSPTGHLHIGGARTALFNYLLARRQGGRFVLRIEDTDAARSTGEYTESILGAMRWLGLEWDGDPVFQRARSDIHRQRVLGLVEAGRAYWCHCPPEAIEASRAKALAEGGKPRYDGRCRELGLGPAPGAVVRFKGPDGGPVGWRDEIKGPIVFDAAELDDLVILRSDGLPTYNLAVVVDDIDMGITHVVRGDDHVNNTPRQILLYRALDAVPPAFGHVPMILGADKSRLSKRHGATAVLAYRDMGYLPQAMNNYLARLGWSHGDQEIFSLQEMVSLFELSRVGKAAAVFNPEKLNWINAHYIKETPPKELADLMWPRLAAMGFGRPQGDLMIRIVATVRERGKTIAELAEKSAFYFVRDVELDPQAAQKVLTPQGMEILSDLGRALSVSPPADPESFDRLLSEAAEARGIKKGAVAQPLRLALTGSLASPGLWDIIGILGPETTARRIRAALDHKA
jgi:glutamyl-tRNA synthetase